MIYRYPTGKQMPAWAQFLAQKHDVGLQHPKPLGCCNRRTAAHFRPLLSRLAECRETLIPTNSIHSRRDLRENPCTANFVSSHASSKSKEQIHGSGMASV
jgi:hypothetical protein